MIQLKAKKHPKALIGSMVVVLLCFGIVVGAQALPLPFATTDSPEDASASADAPTTDTHPLDPPPAATEQLAATGIDDSQNQELSIAATSANMPMYRLYNQWTQEHFYTASADERARLLDAGWNNENIGWYAPSGVTQHPVYRLYNPYTDDHHYTMYKEEYDGLVEKGWSGEEIGWYSDDAETIPIWREYNPWLTQGAHNYTSSEAEHKHLCEIGWQDEQIGWYGVAWPVEGTYTITYNLDGGTADLTNLPTTYTAESETLNITLPAAPTKDNYRFYRWENEAGEAVTTLTIPKGSTGDITVTAKWMTTLNVEYVETHTQQEIANYIAQSGFDPNMPDGDTLSDISTGNVGTVSKEVQDNALAGFNIIRYLAGVKPVTFDQGAYDKAQAGAAYMAYTGEVTHNPNRSRVPASTPADVFDRAAHGCGESNVVAGSGIANVVIGSFVPDPGNITNGKGHRRYCLNPALKTAAFGSATNRHADGSVHGGRTLYVMNEGAPYNQHFTVWPPANMPMEYYPKVNSARTYWTVCLHRQGQITAQKANLVVTLKYDGKTVTLRPDEGDCYFYAGTLMWRIDRDVKAGDRIEVKVEGVTDHQGRAVPIEYTVNFFSLSDYQTSAQSVQPYALSVDAQDFSATNAMDMIDVTDAATAVNDALSAAEVESFSTATVNKTAQAIDAIKSKRVELPAAIRNTKIPLPLTS